MSILSAYATPHPPLIIPTVGRGEERAIRRTVDAYREVARRIVSQRPDTIVVTTPHAPLYRDAFHVTTDAQLAGDMGAFRAPQTRLSVAIDTKLVSALIARAQDADLPLAPSTPRDREMDHATFVPLFFIEEAAREAGIDLPSLVRIGLSALPTRAHRDLGHALARAIDDAGRRTVIVASGDCSHKLTADGPYGFAAEGPKLDAQLCRIFETGALDELFNLSEDFCERAAECGVRSFQIMAGALEATGQPIESELLSYEGPFGVGYAVAAFEVSVAGAEPDAGEDAGAGSDEGADAGERPGAGALSDAAPGESTSEDAFVALARASVEHYVRTGEMLPVPSGLPSTLANAHAGAFVSLHENGELRGCIGTIAPATENLAEEIVRNAVSAAARDPRFEPVRADELPHLDISVDVLTEPEPIASPDELDPARYGVIVIKGWRRGLLLPDLEGVDTVADQIAIAKQKAGIATADDDVTLERFEVVRHESIPRG